MLATIVPSTPSPQLTHPVRSQQSVRTVRSVRAKPVEKTVKYHRGKPTGIVRMQNYEAWDNDIRRIGSPLNSIEDFHRYFNYRSLFRTYTDAQEFRAGIILVYQCEMLMVHQKPTTYLDDSIEKSLGMRRGFPKGGRNADDISALDTALREVREETGINVTDTLYNARLSVSTFIIPHVYEVFIYFVCVVDTKPTITICEQELDGYEWIDVKSGLRGIRSTTIPTARLLCELENVDFGKMQTISIAFQK